MSRDPAVGVVGGGITGLSLAHYLAERGVRFELFEARPEPGGVVRSECVEGCLVEWGPQRIRRTDHIDALVGDLDLGDEVRTADPDLPVCVYADGALRPAPFSLAEFAATDLLSPRAKLDVLGEPFTDPADPNETAAELFVRKFGGETYRNLLGPLFGGIYGSDPAEMPVEHALSGLLALEERYGSLLTAAIVRAEGGSATPPALSFDDGLQRLPEALAAAHADRVHLGTRVTTVWESGDGFALATPAGTETVEQVVVTAPAAGAADLLADLAPDAAAALDELTYNPFALVALRTDLGTRDGVPDDALGYQVGLDEDLRTLGVTWNASAFDRDVVTCFLGGMRDPGVFEESDATLGEVAVAEFEAVTGADADVLAVERLRPGVPAYDASWAALDRVDLPDGVRLATNYTARIGVPSRVREAEALAEDLAGT